MATPAEGGTSLPLSPEQRVALMEQTRAYGKTLLTAILKALSNSSSNTNPDVEQWQKCCEKWTKSTGTYEILVGIVGETGQGKSSLLNEILGFDISLISHHSACTAAVCVFSWNESDDPQKLFRAEITYKSYTSVKQELLAYLEERDEVNHFLADPDYAHDADVSTRKKELDSLEKVIQAWSGLKLADLKTVTTPDEIIRRSNHPAFKDGVEDATARNKQDKRAVSAPKLPNFKKQMKRFVDGVTTRNNDEVKDWPLVDVVEIFIKSDVLRNHIKLVDLPGLLDALEARAAVSKSYMWRLDKRIVAVNASRGADSKAASDLLLPSTEMMQMELDNELGPDSLAVAVNKIDDMSTDRADEHWPDDERVNNAFDALASLDERISAANEAIREAKDNISEAQADIDDGRDENVDHSSIDPSASKKRGRSVSGDAVDTDEIAGYRRQLSAAENELQALEGKRPELESQLKHCCIEARNELHRNKITENLRAERARIRSNDKLGDSFVANVFPTSSYAHAKLKKGVAFAGFPDIKSTGVDTLRQWIVQSTLPNREEIVQGHLQTMLILIDAVDGWTQEVDLASDPDDRLPLSELERLTELLTMKNDGLARHIHSRVRNKLSKRLSGLRPLRHTHLGMRNKGDFQDDDGVEKSARIMKREVERWDAKPRGLGKMHFMTFKACVRKRGGRFTTSTTPRITYHWMGTVYEAFWRPCLKHWHEEFHKKLPLYEGFAISTARRQFRDFVTDLTTDEKVPQVLRDVLKQRMYYLENVLEAYIKVIKTNLQRFKSQARQLRLIAEENMIENLRAVFDEAKATTGKGSYEKMRVAIQTYIHNNMQAIFIQVRNMVEKSLYRLTRNAAGAIQRHWSSSGKKLLAAHLERMVKACCVPPPGSRQMSLNGGVKTEEATKKEIQAIVRMWRKHWAVVEPQLPKPEIGMTFDEVEAEEQKKMELKKANKGSKKGAKSKAAKSESAPVPKVEEEEDDDSETDGGEDSEPVIKQEEKESMFFD